MRLRCATGSDGVFLAALVFSACSEAPLPHSPPNTSVDSAGVEIVTSERPEWSPSEGWSVVADPALEIGRPDGDARYQLFGVAAILALADGGIAVANGSTGQIRVYDALGAHVRDFGGLGDGPGEFRSLESVWSIAGDSIVATDRRTPRMTVFDREGRVGRTIPLETGAVGGPLRGQRPFSDGTLLAVATVPFEGEPRPGLFDGGGLSWHRFSSEGEYLNPIAAHERGPYWGFTVEGSQAYTVAPFTISALPSASDGVAVYMGTGSGPVVERRAPEGTLLRLIRWRHEPRPVTDELSARYVEERLAEPMSEEALSVERALLHGIAFPPHFPTYRALLVDAEAHLWVGRYRTPWDEEQRWWIFDPSGRWLGEVVVPSALSVHAIGRDHLLGVRRDANDVEYVVKFSLQR